MDKQQVIAIFDIGKTNKKLFLFDEQYQIVFEKTVVIPEIKDEDDFPCEDLGKLCSFVRAAFHEVLTSENFQIKAINFCAYGASFVLVGANGNPDAPLYNYLKPYPENLLRQFYDAYGGEENFSSQTASPVLGSLNSGMQLYRLKYEKPELFRNIHHAFHLPQFLSYLICGSHCSDITSIGCHTNLWNFRNNTYHDWVYREGIVDKLFPIVPCDTIINCSQENHHFDAGIGMHDSSAALIPYLFAFQEPFTLISTGTWCISLNPFNESPLTREELENDCLCYLQHNGKPVKASRLLSGYTHDEQVKRIADHFHASVEKYKHLRFNNDIVSRLSGSKEPPSLKRCAFEERSVSTFSSDDEAYHQLIADLISQQIVSSNLVARSGDIKKIFVDGGFSKNEIYMNLLAQGFPGTKVYAASIAQASALGAALVIHNNLNMQPAEANMIELRAYTSTVSSS
jgi:sugar (pentulose or hexulose) kinase